MADGLGRPPELVTRQRRHRDHDLVCAAEPPAAHAAPPVVDERPGALVGAGPARDTRLAWPRSARLAPARGPAGRRADRCPRPGLRFPFWGASDTAERLVRRAGDRFRGVVLVGDRALADFAPYGQLVLQIDGPSF